MPTKLDAHEYSIFLQGQIDRSLGLARFHVLSVYGGELTPDEIEVWGRGWDFAEEKAYNATL